MLRNQSKPPATTQIKRPAKNVIVAFSLPADVKKLVDRERDLRNSNRSAALASIVREWGELKKSKKIAKAKKSAQRNGAAKGK